MSAPRLALAALLLAVLAPLAGAAPPTPAHFVLSFKLDPRLAGPTYGGERWVSPPVYTGASAQNAVEVRARVADAAGRAVPGTIHWTPSDPEVVNVAPATGERVTLTARQAGRCRVTVTAGGAVTVLEVEAARPGGVWQLAIKK